MKPETRKCKKCGLTKDILDFPRHDKGYRHECKHCQRLRIAKWENDNREQKRSNARESYYRMKADPERNAKHLANRRVFGNTYAARVRHAAFERYGGYVCACCGETNPFFLTIDHINNDGHIHRKEGSASQLYSWLKARKYPDGFQVLCYNCNLGKARNGGVCPHQACQEGSETIAQASTLK